MQVNFGDVQWGQEVEFPRPARVGALRGVHGVSSDSVVVVDAQTLLVPNFSYDGEAPGKILPYMFWWKMESARLLMLYFYDVHNAMHSCYSRFVFKNAF